MIRSAVSRAVRAAKFLHIFRDRLSFASHGAPKSLTILSTSLVLAAASLGIAEAAVRAQTHQRHDPAASLAADAAAPDPDRVRTRLVWEGADLDGDGQPDIADPTGQAPRGADAYGEGRFHAARDGGTRDHEGVDYVATPGQAVVAPISGYVTKIGLAYPGDETLKFVEIENPALHLTARAFYVDPDVAVGDTIGVGQPIGHAHSLQRRYPLGITDHIHLEIARAGRKLDAETLIAARVETDRIAAD
jgi:murein DD-endopeptidase MepM/ murein hydrolase activator NlpD